MQRPQKKTHRDSSGVGVVIPKAGAGSGLAGDAGASSVLREFLIGVNVLASLEAHITSFHPHYYGGGSLGTSCSILQLGEG